MGGVAFMVDSNHPLKKASMKTFTGYVIKGILAMNLSDSVQPTRAYIPSVVPVGEVLLAGNLLPVLQLIDLSGCADIVAGDIIAIPPGAPGIPFDFLQMHPKCKLKRKEHGDCRAKGCKGKVMTMCGNANCRKWYCDSASTRDGERYCFYSHVAELFIKSRRAGPTWEVAYQEWKNTQDYLT